jgi:hypothetical protein
MAPVANGKVAGALCDELRKTDFSTVECSQTTLFTLNVKSVICIFSVK